MKLRMIFLDKVWYSTKIWYYFLCTGLLYSKYAKFVCSNSWLWTNVLVNAITCNW